jgi:hypothetical protein
MEHELEEQKQPKHVHKNAQIMGSVFKIPCFSLKLQIYGLVVGEFTSWNRATNNI